MSKRKKPNPPSPVVPPPVAESATDVQPEYPPCFPYVPDVPDEDQVYLPPEPIVCEPVTVTVSRPEPELPLPPAPVQVERSDRISAGKLIARQSGIPPAAAQQIAAGLPDVTVLAVLAVQLEPDAAARIREILGY